MKIAVISDVHANSFALKAVLEDMPAVDYLVCAGDITGYHRQVNEVFDLLSSVGARMILGNHDYYLVHGYFHPPGPVIARSVEYTLDHIKEENLEIIRGLPQSLMLKIDGLTLHLFHGSPMDPLREYVFTDSPRLLQCSKAPGRIIIMGHTHRPFLKKIVDKWILNPGSVGQPRGDITQASYAMIDTKLMNIDINFVDCFDGFNWDESLIARRYADVFEE